MDVESENVYASDLPPRPKTRPPPPRPPSVFFSYMEQILTDPSRRGQPGYLTIDDTSLQLIITLMAKEVARAQQLQEMFTSLRSDLTTTRSELTSMSTRLAALENTSPDRPTLQQSIHAPDNQGRTTQKHTASYESKVAANTPNTPKKTPPPQHLINVFKPGRAIIHVAPESLGMEKINKEILIDKANDALKELDGTVDDEHITTKALEVLKSGDVCFFAKNRAHQKWLMEHKHRWSKKVHPDLTSTPSTTAETVYNMHTFLDVTNALVRSRIGIANGFVDADVL
ncbi:hypothetical protein H4Q26_013178 [Puccinia striiformis f. sp. tritici PST-130]|nr:hypothetical protein H4Q26_013178 [Puccinia striiformis f. sp. tritici PST-130]